MVMTLTETTGVRPRVLDSAVVPGRLTRPARFDTPRRVKVFYRGGHVKTAENVVGIRPVGKSLLFDRDYGNRVVTCPYHARNIIAVHIVEELSPALSHRT